MGDNRGGGGGGRSPLTVETTREMPHPTRRHCCCRRCRPPSRRSTSRAEEHVAGGAPSSADANLDAVPADKENVIDIDNDGAMVAAVIATPDTTGGDDAREAIVLALSSSTRRALTVISLVMNTFFSSFNYVELPHSMLVDCCMSCCRTRLCIPTEFRRIPEEFRQKAPAGTEFDRNSPE